MALGLKDRQDEDLNPAHNPSQDSFDDLVSRELGDVEGSGKHIIDRHNRSGNIAGSEKSPDLKVPKGSLNSLQKNEQPSAPIKYTKPSEGANNKSSKASGSFGKRRAGIIGVFTTLGLFGGMFGVSSVLSGPAQFISAMNVAKDAYMALTDAQQAARYMKSVKDFVSASAHSSIKGAIVQSRVGISGEIVAKKFEKRLAGSGITIDKKLLNSFEGMTINVDEFTGTKVFGNARNQTAKLDFASKKLGVDTSNLSISKDGKSVTFKGDMSRRDLLRLLEEMDQKAGGRFKVVSKINSRIATKAMGSYSWLHPIKRAEMKAVAKFEDFLKKRMDERKKKANTKSLGADKENKNLIDSDGKLNGDGDAVEKGAKDAEKAATKALGEAEDAAPEVGKLTKYTEKLLKPSAGLKIAGGAVAVAGIICMAKDLNKQVGLNKFMNVIIPAVASVTELMGIASQIMSGEDFTADQLGNYSKLLMYNDNITTTNVATGETTTKASSWWDSPAVQAALGLPHVDLAKDSDTPAEISKIMDSKLGFLSFLNNAPGVIGNALDGVCGVFGLFDKVLEPLTNVIGEWILKIPGIAGLMAGAMGWLFGDGLNTDEATPKQKGTIQLFGEKNLANNQIMINGAGTVSGVKRSELNELREQYLADIYSRESTANKLFDPSNYRSVLSTFGRIANINTSDRSFLTQFKNAGKMMLSVPSVFASVISGQTVGAATAAEPMDFGLPTFAFTSNEMSVMLNSEDFSAPTNGNNAIDIFNSSEGDTYRSLLKECNGIIIGDAPDYKVSAVDMTEQDENSLLNPYDMTQSKYKADCINNPKTASIDSLSKIASTGQVAATIDKNSDAAKWFAVRLYALDYNNLNSGACIEGNEDNESTKEACADSESDITNDQSPGSDSTGTDSINLSELYKDSSGISCAEGTEDTGVKDGYHDGNKFNVRLCSVPTLGKVNVNSRISKATIDMANAMKKDGLTTTASGFRSNEEQSYLYGCFQSGNCNGGNEAARPGYSNHQAGLALDITMPSARSVRANCKYVNKVCTLKGDKIYDWLVKNASKYGFTQYSGEFWHWEVTSD